MRIRRIALTAMGIACAVMMAYSLAVAEPSPLGWHSEREYEACK